MTREQLKNIEIPGEVVNIADPYKKGRVKIKVTSVYDKLNDDDIPWASPLKETHGKSFRRPEVGQIVNVRFEDGDWYRPFYSYAEHYNINLQKKLEELDDGNYSDFSAIHFDDRLQLYKDSEKCVLDFDLSNIKIDDDGNISHNLRDGDSYLYMGSPDASQEAMLGTHWLSWFDDLVQVLFKPYLGNSGAPVVADPTLIKVLNDYYALRNNFVSKHVYITDNDMVKKQERINEKLKGDNWKSTVKENELTFTYDEPYIPIEREDSVIPDIKDSGGAPPDAFVSFEVEGNENDVGNPIIKKPIKGNSENGKIPLDKLTTSRYLSKNLKGGSAKLVDEAANAFDQMMDAYKASSFEGKQKIVFTDGYRTYNTQISLKKKYGAGAGGRWYVGSTKKGHNYTPKGVPGEVFKATSNHGWGLAVDMWWGIQTKYRKIKNIREVVFRHPVYTWFFVNGPRFGWYNPARIRDNKGVDEWWHWEYRGTTETQVYGSSAYSQAFDFVADFNFLKSKANMKWKGIGSGKV